MRFVSRIIIAAFCLWICGCGSGNNKVNPTLNITAGNWQVSTVSTTTHGALGIGGTSLSQTGTTVNGIMHLVFPPCFNSIQDINVNGTVSGVTVNLTSSMVNGQMLSLTTAGSDKLLTGSYSSSGSCGSPDQGTVTVTFVPPATGTWHGTLTSNSGAVTQVTVSLTQTGPNADGSFPVSGSVTFSGTCLAPGTVSGLANGPVLSLSVIPGDPTTSGAIAIGGSMTDPTTATAFSGAYASNESGCTDSGKASLSKSP